MFDRIFWIAALISSLACTILLSKDVIVKIRDFPIVMYYAYKPISVTEVNFPAVTICPGIDTSAGELKDQQKIEEGKMKLEDLKENR